MAASDRAVYCFEGFKLEPAERRLSAAAGRIHLPPKVFDTLVLLVQRAGCVVTKDEITGAIWPRGYVDESNLIKHIWAIRRALKDVGEDSHFIETVPKVGYRFAARVTLLRAEELASSSAAVPARAVEPPAEAALTDQSAAVARDGSQQTSESPTNGARRWLVPMVAVALLVSVGGVWWRFEHHPGAPSAPVTLAEGARPTGSIAVLPFANLTGDPAKDYFGDGVVEELINTLARVPGLKVPARTSMFAYKGRNADIRRVGRDLGVATVLEGSVRGAGDRLRVRARLVDAATGFEIWEQDFDRPGSDLFKLQDDLAVQITAALNGYWRGSLQAPPATRRPTENLEAYSLYQQSLYVGRGTVPSVRQALPLINQALERDPGFAEAYALRAIERAGMVVLGGASAAQILEADRDVEQALALDPESAMAHTAAEVMNFSRGRWLAAEAEFRKAMQTGGDDPMVRNFHSVFIARAAGHLRQSESELMDSYHLGPVNGWTVHELARAESLLAEDAAALRFADLSDDLNGAGNPSGWDIALARAAAAARSGHHAEAARAIAPVLPEALRLDGAQVLQSAYAATGDPSRRAAARRALDGLAPRVTLIGDPRIRAFFIAAYAGIADFDGAYRLASRLADLGAPGLPISGDLWAPEMRSFREDRRFSTLMARTGLFEYWKLYGPPDDCELRGGSLTCH